MAGFLKGKTENQQPVGVEKYVVDAIFDPEKSKRRTKRFGERLDGSATWSQGSTRKLPGPFFRSILEEAEISRDKNDSCKESHVRDEP